MGWCVCVVVLYAFLCCVHSQRYIVPEATLEFLSPRGLRISIPDDDPEIKLVAYHINVNTELQGLEHGQYGIDITNKKNGRWSYHIPDFKAKQGDVIYYWIYVIVDKLGYNGLNREYKVTQANPHGVGSPGGPHPPVSPSSCPPSQTSRDGVTTPVCQGELLLHEHFYDMDGWKHQVTIGGDGPEDEFMVFSKESSNSWLDNGKLVIKPTLLEDKYNDSFVRNGELVLVGCTSYVDEQCVKRAQLYLILPPIISARLSTKDKFSFRYGTVEIRAKLPRGKWIVPELWLEPVNGPSMEKVVMGLSRGNTDDSEFGWRTLEAGVMGESQSSLQKMTQGTPWSQDFHTFKIEWKPEGIKFIVDGQDMHRIPAVNYSILSKEVYISLGVHVAGNRDFPDNINNKPWKNSDPKTLVWKTYPRYIIETYDKFEALGGGHRNVTLRYLWESGLDQRYVTHAFKRFAKFWDDKRNWYPTWNEESSLQVEYIKVTAL